MATILIVDDEVAVVRVMTIWLERNDHEVITAQDGKEALTQLQQNNIDLMITDMNMPAQNGLSLIQEIRDSGNHTLPVILLTARCDQEKLSQKLEPYFVRVYPKPFVPSKLVEEINRLLEVKVS